jgi:hypothetical protein
MLSKTKVELMTQRFQANAIPLEKGATRLSRRWRYSPTITTYHDLKSRRNQASYSIVGLRQVHVNNVIFFDDDVVISISSTARAMYMLHYVRRSFTRDT